MFKIRRGTFETNSSSTHSICICTEDDFNKYVNGDLILDYWNGELIEIPENLTRRMDPDSDEYDYDAVDCYRPYDYEAELEWYDYHFTTPSGDKMVAFGWYGHD